MDDQQNFFCEDQAVTATAATTDYINLGPFEDGLGNTVNSKTRFQGLPIYVVVACTVAMTDGSSDSTLAFTLETDDNTSFSSATTVDLGITFPATSAAGTRYWKRLPPDVDYEKYLRGKFTPANGNLTTGSFTAKLTLQQPSWMSGAFGRTYSKGTA